ncbi:hypothetical protein KJ616_02895 [Patescibacteria group bacterium]|nr:hypothetical protein [Patescibacteria group bacterium]
MVGLFGTILSAECPLEEWMNGMSVATAHTLVGAIGGVVMIIGLVLLITSPPRRKARSGNLVEGETYLVVQAGPKGGETQFFYLAPVNMGARNAVRREFRSEEVPLEIGTNCIVQIRKKGLSLVAKVDFAPVQEKTR